MEYPEETLKNNLMSLLVLWSDTRTFGRSSSTEFFTQHKLPISCTEDLHHRGYTKLRTPSKKEALYREDSTTTKEDKGSESLLQIQGSQALDTGPRRDLRCRHEGCARNMEFFQTQRLRDIIQHSPARLSQNVVIHERGKANTCTKTHVAITFANQSHKVEDAPWNTQTNLSFTRWRSEKRTMPEETLGQTQASPSRWTLTPNPETPEL